MDKATVSWDKRWSNLKLKISKNNAHMTLDMFYELLELLKLLRVLGSSGVDNIVKPTKPTPPPNVTNPNEPEEVEPEPVKPTPPPTSEDQDEYGDITAEEIRDLLSALSGEDRLDAKYIKNISDNIFVNMGGTQVPLHTFLKFLFDQINKEQIKEVLTREELIEILGFEPLKPSTIVQDLSDPKPNTVLSTSGLQLLINEITDKHIKVHFTGVDEVEVPHTFSDIWEPEIWINNRRIQTYYESVTNKLILKFSELVSGYVIIKNYVQ